MPAAPEVTICEKCRMSPARFAQERRFDGDRQVCGSCATAIKLADRRAKLTPFDVPAGAVIAVTQQSLFDAGDTYHVPVEAPPFVATSPTSLGAAQQIATAARSLRGRVLQDLVVNGPASDEQLQERLGMNPSTQRPRRVELVDRGLVHKVGETKTQSGRKAAQWGATERGRAWIV